MLIDMRNKFTTKMANNLNSKSDIEKSLWLEAQSKEVKKEVLGIRAKRNAFSQKRGG